MTIRDFIIHRIDKEQFEEPVSELRSQVLDNEDQRVVRFVQLASQVFEVGDDSPKKLYADFNADRTQYPLSSWCLNYFVGTSGFVSFTHDCTRRLMNCMRAAVASTGGHVVFCTFENEGALRLMIVMLHSQSGLSITPELEFAEVTHLELKQIDKAALINAPEGGEFGERALTYAGFRKAMSQYFQEFIGPDEFRNPSRDSNLLIDRTEDYVRENNLDRDSIRASVRAYALQAAASGEYLELSVVASLVDPHNTGRFIAFANSHQISSFIKPDPNRFKKWKLIRHTTSDGLLLQFKAELVGLPGTHQRLELDAANRTILINDIDDTLIQKIQESRR